VDSADSKSSDSAALYAPGREILTLLPGGRYDFASGNSLATAHVTGAVALLLAKNSGLSGSDLQELLQRTSAHALPLGESGNSVDACGAVTTLIGHGNCRAAAGDGDDRVAAR
jgi:subtilisin family serine protease